MSDKQIYSWLLETLAWYLRKNHNTQPKYGFKEQLRLKRKPPHVRIADLFLDNVKTVLHKIRFWKKVGFTECLRLLNPIKALAMPICSIIVRFITLRALDAWRGLWICVRRNN